jgi:hypothetical protein
MTSRTTTFEYTDLIDCPYKQETGCTQSVVYPYSDKKDTIEYLDRVERQVKGFPLNPNNKQEHQDCRKSTRRPAIDVEEVLRRAEQVRFEREYFPPQQYMTQATEESPELRAQRLAKSTPYKRYVKQPCPLGCGQEVSFEVNLVKSNALTKITEGGALDPSTLKLHDCPEHIEDKGIRLLSRKLQALENRIIEQDKRIRNLEREVRRMCY